MVLKSAVNFFIYRLDLLTDQTTTFFSLKNLQNFSLDFKSNGNLHYQDLEGIWTIKHLKLAYAFLFL